MKHAHSASQPLSSIGTANNAWGALQENPFKPCTRDRLTHLKDEAIGVSI